MQTAKPEAPEHLIIDRKLSASSTDSTMAQPPTPPEFEQQSSVSSVSTLAEKVAQSLLGKCTNFHHLTFWVSNAKQAALYFCVHYGFDLYAYAGLETGSRDIASHVVRQGRILIQFSSPLTERAAELTAHIARHGDGVRDIAFEVDSVERVLERARNKGAKVLQNLQTSEDSNGRVKTATVSAFGDTCHTFVEKQHYQGCFLPNYVLVKRELLLLKQLPPVGLEFIDHCVAGQLDNDMKNVSDWYQHNLAFHRFWSVDDVDIVTDYSSLR